MRASQGEAAEQEALVGLVVEVARAVLAALADTVAAEALVAVV